MGLALDAKVSKSERFFHHGKPSHAIVEMTDLLLWTYVTSKWNRKPNLARFEHGTETRLDWYFHNDILPIQKSKVFWFGPIVLKNSMRPSILGWKTFEHSNKKKGPTNLLESFTAA